MAFANAHILVRLQGVFGGNPSSPQDHWSTGFRLAIVGADVPYSYTGLTSLCTAIATAGKTMIETAGAGGGNTYLTTVTAARVGTNGKYDPLSQTTAMAPLPAPGYAKPSAAPSYPFSTAFVVSLRTARTRGYASNGRFYWPMTATGGYEDVTGRISATEVQNKLNLVFKPFFQAVNTAASAYAQNMRLAVCSSKGEVTELVTQLRADGRFDAQERRENNIKSVYSVATL